MCVSFCLPLFLKYEDEMIFYRYLKNLIKECIEMAFKIELVSGKGMKTYILEIVLGSYVIP